MTLSKERISSEIYTKSKYRSKIPCNASSPLSLSLYTDYTPEMAKFLHQTVFRTLVDWTVQFVRFAQFGENFIGKKWQFLHFINY